MARNTEIRENTGGRENKSVAYQFKSLEEYINAELKAEQETVKKVSKLKVEADKKRIKENVAIQRQGIEELARLERQLDLKGIKMSNTEKKAFMYKFNKEMADLEKKRVLDYWKQYSAEARHTQKEQDREYKRGEDYYKKVAKLRQQAANYDNVVNETKKKLLEAENSGKKDEVDKLKKKLSSLEKQKSHAEEKNKGRIQEARSTENAGLFGEELEGAFSDFIKEMDKDLGMGNGEVWGKDLVNAMKGVGQAITEGLNEINTAISKYAEYRTGINARLQGISDKVNVFDDLEHSLAKVSYSPLIRTETLYENLSTLVAEGIAANVDQRAFLQTIKDGIATTFDANDSSLRRIIRLQQYDSTAARLGMEAYLTTYLNELTKNTEYLQSTFDSVAGSLIEASSLMSAKASTEFEYVIQKWLGTLTGLGLDEGTATNIASAVGYLGSGNINALNSTELQNL